MGLLVTQCFLDFDSSYRRNLSGSAEVFAANSPGLTDYAREAARGVAEGAGNVASAAADPALLRAADINPGSFRNYLSDFGDSLPELFTRGQEIVDTLMKGAQLGFARFPDPYWPVTLECPPRRAWDHPTAGCRGRCREEVRRHPDRRGTPGPRRRQGRRPKTRTRPHPAVGRRVRGRPGPH